jgi:hypothetical protein
MTVAAELSDTAEKDVFEVTVLSLKDELDVITLSRSGGGGQTAGLKCKPSPFQHFKH